MTIMLNDNGFMRISTLLSVINFQMRAICHKLIPEHHLMEPQKQSVPGQKIIRSILPLLIIMVILYLYKEYNEIEKGGIMTSNKFTQKHKCFARFTAACA